MFINKILQVMGSHWGTRSAMSNRNALLGQKLCHSLCEGRTL